MASPTDASTDRKDDMQETLHDLIVSVFRKRPKLHYFQVRVEVLYESAIQLMGD